MQNQFCPVYMLSIVAKKIGKLYFISKTILTKKNFVLDKYFDSWVMSVHFVANQPITRKTGKPWWREMEQKETILTSKQCETLIQDLVTEVGASDDSFVEIDRRYSKVIQSGPYRIVIVLPPLSKRIEITAVRPVKSMNLEDYKLDDWLQTRLLEEANWVLITWAPWEWKSTFATAYVNKLAQKNIVIKTIESPRDLQVDEKITQYSFSHAPHNEIRDILLLSRPDVCIYDEVRNKEDFILFKDLRLTWIWLIWVMHATKAIDWIQRMIWTIELGLIPQIIDTVVYIKSWNIDQVYSLEQTVKTPLWMNSDDLARPVILVKDLISDEVRYEMYSYGESVVVMPTDMVWLTTTSKNAISKYAKRWLQDYFEKELNCNVAVEVESSSRILVYVPDYVKPKFIGKGWTRIQQYEKELWVGIWVREMSEYGSWNNTSSSVPYEIHEVNKWKKTMLQIQLSKERAHEEVTCMIWWKLMTFVVNHHGVIQIRRKKLVDEILGWAFAIVA